MAPKQSIGRLKSIVGGERVVLLLKRRLNRDCSSAHVRAAKKQPPQREDF